MTLFLETQGVEGRWVLTEVDFCVLLLGRSLRTELPHIFERFSKWKSKRCKEILRAMGGDPSRKEMDKEDSKMYFK